MVSVVSGCSIVSVAKCLTRCLSSPPVWLALMLCEQLLWFFGRGNRFVSGKCLFPPSPVLLLKIEILLPRAFFHTTFLQEDSCHYIAEMYECFKAHPENFCRCQSSTNTNGILPFHCLPNSLLPDAFDFLLTACAYWQMPCKA